RNDVLGGILHNETPGCRFTRKGDLGDAFVRGQGSSDLGSRPVDDVEYAGRDDVTDDFGELEDRPGGWTGWFDNRAVPRGQRRSDFPGGHQKWEIERNDLPDHAEWLIEVVGDRVFVDFRDTPFLGTDRASKVAEVVNCQW